MQISEIAELTDRLRKELVAILKKEDDGTDVAKAVALCSDYFCHQIATLSCWFAEHIDAHNLEHTRSILNEIDLGKPRQ